MYFYVVCPCGFQSRSYVTDEAAQGMATHHLSITAEIAAEYYTVAERLDAARTGEEFGQVLNNLFGSLAPREESE